MVRYQAMNRYVLGIDAGTESIRAGLYDLNGNCVGFGVESNETQHARPGWAEQSPDRWQRAMVQAVRSALASAGVSGSQVCGLSVDGTTCTLVFADAHGRPLRDAIMWMDVRAVREAQITADTGHTALKYVGHGPVSAEWFPCKALWVRNHEPETYERCHTILEQTDWLTFAITGEVGANINTASTRWFYDARDGDYPVSFYQQLGLQEISERLPRPVRSIGEQAGEVSERFAAETGLLAGTPVATGGGDAWMAAIGVQTVRPGRVALITGSSQVHVGLSQTELHARGLFGSYPDAMIPGLHVVEGGQTSTGSVLNWFVKNFVGEEVHAEARRRQCSPYDILTARAEDIPPGSEGLVILEHWQGNRTPWVDPTSRGVIRGLTLRHTPAHVYRAILEAVAYGTEVVFRRMRENGFAPSELIACGGATNSPFWMQLHADVTGLPITTAQEQQAACLGSAIAAAVGAGEYDTIGEAADAMVHTARRIEPRPGESERYRDFVDQYTATYEQLHELSRELTMLAETGNT